MAECLRLDKILLYDYPLKSHSDFVAAADTLFGSYSAVGDQYWRLVTEFSMLLSFSWLRVLSSELLLALPLFFLKSPSL
jgi:hypothetical protein